MAHLLLLTSVQTSVRRASTHAHAPLPPRCAETGVESCWSRAPPCSTDSPGPLAGDHTVDHSPPLATPGVAISADPRTSLVAPALPPASCELGAPGSIRVVSAAASDALPPAAGPACCAASLTWVVTACITASVGLG